MSRTPVCGRSSGLFGERSRMRKRLAMSLAELLLAIGLFAIIAYALMGIWITHSKTLEKSQSLFAATQVAESRLTEQVGLGFRCSERQGVTRIRRWVDDVMYEEEYRWKVGVTDTNPQTPDLKHVKVVVEWDERGQKKSIQMVTSVYWQG